MVKKVTCKVVTTFSFSITDNADAMKFFTQIGKLMYSNVTQL
jgi:hypothetical protein